MHSLKTKTILLLFLGSLFALNARAQKTIAVAGTVSNEKGEPLSNVSVVVKSTSQGTTTDNKGSFQLNAPENATLVVSLIGYEAKQVKATAVVNLVLNSVDRILADVVVIGYGTQRKKELTGSISTVSAKDFQKGVITTPEQLIAGKVAGVSVVSNDGAPGSGSIIRIRGGASLNASNDPLIVIDGIPLSGNNIYGATNPLSLVNPNDIETFTVLKDAAATAIYGSRASNGVIIITTKKGSGKKPVINFNTQVSVSNLVKKVDVQSADAFRKYIDSVGTGTYNGTDTYKSLMGSASTDWQDEIYRSAITTDNNISVTGAAKNLPYRVSLGYLNQNGILKTGNLQRFSGGISLNPRLLKDRLKVNVNLKGAVTKSRFANYDAISAAAYFDPTQPVHANSPFGGYYEWADYDANPVVLNKLAPKNPVALLDLYHNESKVNRSYGNIQLDYSLPFLPELHANLNLGYDIAKGSGTIDVPAYAAQNYLDSGQRNQYGNKTNSKVSEFYLNYVKDLKKIKSNINLTGGYGYYNNVSTNYSYPFIRANGDTAFPASPLRKPENTLLSFYGRLIYTLNNKYILAASIRSDKSSKFSPENRVGTFPSVAFTWRINNEAFLVNAKVLSDLKVRLSYGATGNQDGINDYPYQAVYSIDTLSAGSTVQFGNNYYYMGTPTAYDANIKWEQTATSNLGLDIGFFKNRVTASLDLYYKKTKDLLNITPIPLGSNFDSRILTNIGNSENKGIELQLNADIIRKSNYSWSVSVNGSYNKNKITNLTATSDSSFKGSPVGNTGVIINTVGYEVNSFYVYKQEYLNGKPVEGVYADLNNDGIINANDRYHYKSPSPKYVFGFSTQFSYQRWTLSTVLRANVGNYMYNALSTNAVKSNALNPLVYLANTLSDINYTGFTNAQSQSDYYIQNASFLKMDNLGLTYNAGKLIRNKVALQVSAICQNVFTVTKYKGIDPEIYSGIDNILYPRPRTFVLGINIQY